VGKDDENVLQKLSVTDEDFRFDRLSVRIQGDRPDDDRYARAAQHQLQPGVHQTGQGRQRPSEPALAAGAESPGKEAAGFGDRLLDERKVSSLANTYLRENFGIHEIRAFIAHAAECDAQQKENPDEPVIK